MASRHAKLAGIALTALFFAETGIGPLAAQQDPARAARVWVEIADSAGKPVRNPSTDDVLATTAGEALDILNLGTPAQAGQWELVVYINSRLSSSRSILRLLESLAGQAEQLAALGEVQILLAGETAENLLRTADPSLLQQALLDTSLRTSGDQALRYDRVRFLRSLESANADAASLAQEGLARELAWLRQQQDDLIHWLASRGHASGPRALFVLDEGQGLDPIDFYGQFFADPSSATFDLGGPPDSDELARVLSAYGWILIPTVVPEADGEDDERFSLRTNQSVGFRVRLGGDRSDDETAESEPEPADLLLDVGRVERLADLAAETGGFLLESLESLPGSLTRLASRLPIELSGLPRSGAPTPLEMVTREPRHSVLAPAWVGGTPEAVAEVRIRRSLEGGGDAGELPVRARLIVDPEQLSTAPSRLEVQADLSSAATRSSGEPVPVRVSVGVHLQDGGLLLRHELMYAAPRTDDAWTWEGKLNVPPTSDAAVVVVADLDGDQWGENFAEFVTVTAAEAAAANSLPATTPRTDTGPALRLHPLPPDTRTGKVKVRTVASPDVSEVVFLLDGERVGRRRRAPYDLRIDLGRIPVQRSIIAIAYDSAGSELGRDGLVINEAATSFWVHITEPSPGQKIGPVDVEAALRLPDNRRLESVDYYWNDRYIDTTAEAPHRSRVLIPVDSPAGYIRVVATLDDGSTAEDVVLMNTQRFDSEITVELVELYVVVTDHLGKPVQGLDKRDFLVKEEGSVQELQSFEVAGDLPLTLGLAIDSSLSLFRKLPEVQKAASRFVADLDSDRDRAFLVGFGSSPRLVHPVTGNLARISRAIDTLSPSGNTAVWEAISLSLEELNEANGRKALVVFYDGDDEDESYSFKKTMDLARRSLIPIYLIVMNDEAARTQGRGFGVRSRVAKLDQLSRTGGGRVFYVRTDQDLTPIFEEISQELRSHYLLTYYPERPLQNPEWRPIQIEMVRGELEARTISGYGGG